MIKKMSATASKNTIKQQEQAPTQPQPKLAYCWFSKGEQSGSGVPTRASAVLKALSRLEPVVVADYDVRLYGVISPPGHPADYNQKAPAHLAPYIDRSELSATAEEAKTAIEAFAPDLLIVDTWPGAIAALLSRDNPKRPTNCWAVVRHQPRCFAGLTPEALDRVYAIEPYLDFTFSPTFVKEHCRSAVELEQGVKGAREPFPVGSVPEEQTRYFARHDQAKIKLLPPIVAVEPAEVLEKQEARQALLQMEIERRRLYPDLFPQNQDFDPITDQRPILLVVPSGGGGTMMEGLRFCQWVEGLKQQWGLVDNKAITIHVDRGLQIPELWRYLPGADYLLATAGYNLFFECRYLWRLGKLRCQAKFFGLTDSRADQQYRELHQQRLWKAPRAFGPGAGAGLTGQHGGHAWQTDSENGADVLAEFIWRKLSLSLSRGLGGGGTNPNPNPTESGGTNP